jgi:hypothetical protein
MSFNGVIKRAGPQATRLYTAASGKSVLLVNLDLVNTVYVGGDPSVSAGSPQIPPLGSLTMHDTEDIYATCPTATVQLQVIPGGGSWSPSPQQIAEQISILGINVNVSSAGFVITPTGDMTGFRDTLAITTALSLYQNILFAPGSYYWTNGSVKRAPGQYLTGPGTSAMTVYGVGTGITCQAIPPDLASYGASGHGGGTTGMTFDGTNSGAGSIGYQHGDFEYELLDIEIQNYTGAGSIGYQALNSTWWTERAHGRVKSNNCTTLVSYAVTGGTASFKGTEIRHSMTGGSNQNNGVVIGAGANVYDSKLYFDGDFSGGSAATTAAGLTFGAGATITDSEVQWAVECSAGAHTPMDFSFANSSSTFIRCWGGIDVISPTNWTLSNWPGGGSFFGPINGDANLAGLVRLAQNLTLNNGRSVGRDAGLSVTTGSTITTAGVTYQSVTSPGAVTGVIMQAGTFDGQEIFINSRNAASDIVFAASGSNVNSEFSSGGEQINPQTLYHYLWDEIQALWNPVQ